MFIASEHLDEQILRAGSTWYCKCCNCKPMVTNEESVCCKEVRMSQDHLAGAA